MSTSTALDLIRKREKLVILVCDALSHCLIAATLILLLLLVCPFSAYPQTYTAHIHKRTCQKFYANLNTIFKYDYIIKLRMKFFVSNRFVNQGPGPPAITNLKGNNF